jgi:hypothetical protein
MNERRLRNRVIPIATFSPLCQDMDNPPTPSSPLQHAPIDDRDDRLARVEQALSLLADRLAVLTTTFPPVHGTHIEPVVPDQVEDVPVIPVRNRRYAEVLAVQNYRLRDRAQGLRPDQVATLTNVANQIRPRLDGCFFSGEPALAVLPFLRQLVKIANQSHVSEAALLWIVEDFLRSPARDAFRTQQFLNWPSAVHWLLTTYVPESALDSAVRTLQTTSQNQGEDVRKFGLRLQLQTAALGAFFSTQEVKSLFTQGLRDPVKSLFAANQPSVEFEEVTPLSVLIGRAELLETGTKQTTFVRSSPRYNPGLQSPALVMSDQVEYQNEENECSALLAVETRNGPDTSRWTCFVCYRSGHGWMDCPLLKHVSVIEKEDIVLRRRRYLDSQRQSRSPSPRGTHPHWPKALLSRTPPDSPKNGRAPPQI